MEGVGERQLRTGEDSARVELMLHLGEYNPMWAGDAEWLVQRDGDTWYVQTIKDRLPQ